MIDMRDKYGNAVLFTDELAWQGQFIIEFDQASLFQPKHCVQYTGHEGSFWYRHIQNDIYNTLHRHAHKIVCPFRPEKQSYGQTLFLRDGNRDRSFNNTPFSQLDIKPYKLHIPDLNNASQWTSAFHSSVAHSVTGANVARVDLDVTLSDLYGNSIGLKAGDQGNLTVCAHFKHERVELYAWLVDQATEHRALTTFTSSRHFYLQGGTVPRLSFRLELDSVMT